MIYLILALAVIALTIYLKAPVKDILPVGTLRNWGRNQLFVPSEIAFPKTKEQLIECINKSVQQGWKVKAAGSLHSWSACAVINGGMSVKTTELNKVLHIDPSKKLVKVETGIVLREFYAYLDKYHLALPSVPNVDVITIGGCVSNAVHGTCLEAGTMSDFVEELEMVVYRNSAKGAEIITLRRNTEDPEERHLFEGAVTSFGSLGIIYSVTMRCIPSFNLLVTSKLYDPTTVIDSLPRVTTEHYSALIHVHPINVIGIKTQTPVSNSLLVPTRTDFRSGITRAVAHYAMWCNDPRAGWFQRSFKYPLLYGVNNPIARFFYRKLKALPSITDWRSAEIEPIIPLVKRTPWINLEYAIPIEEVKSVVAGLLATTERFKKEHGYFRMLPFTLRPVAADRAGYMSMTKGRTTCFVDIPYDMEAWEDHKSPKMKFFDEVEQLLLAHGGRVSWSRLFMSTTANILKNYPEFDKFVDVKAKLDPTNLFSNPYSDNILTQSSCPNGKVKVASE